MSIVDNFLEKRAQNRSNPKGEMGFMDHIEELRWHIIRSILVILVCAIVCWFYIEVIFDKVLLGPTHSNFISYKWFGWLGDLLHVDALHMKAVTLSFQNTELSGQFMLSFSVAFMCGFIISFPYIFWEFWRFVKPALKPQELKYARGLVFWASILFGVGVVFAYYIIAPFTINFFGTYQLSPQFKNIITISNYYETMSDLIIGLGIVFELPILVYFLSRIGILSPQFMRQQRRYAIVIILVLAAVITPPDWFSIFLVFIPLMALYEASIFVSAKIMKEKKKKEKETLDW